MRFEIKRITAVDDLQRLLLDRAGPFPAPGRITEGGHTDHHAGRPGLRRRPDGESDDDNFNDDGSRKDRHERKPDYDVMLLCRTFVGDVGNRPLANMVFWESPDIWIEGSSGDPDIATPGELNQVKVHVWNMGLADAWGAHVDLFWCDPSVGIHPAVAHPIGSTTLPIFSGQHQVVSFDWIPEFVNNGHECLVAQVYDPVSDPVVAPFNPVQDRHVGQRNISVLDVPPGNSQMFKFVTQNLSWMQATTTLEVHKIEREALGVLALGMGVRTWRGAGGETARLLPPTVLKHEMLPVESPFLTNVFRETLQGVPGPAETRRVMGALRTLGITLGEEEPDERERDRAGGRRGQRTRVDRRPGFGQLHRQTRLTDAERAELTGRQDAPGEHDSHAVARAPVRVARFDPGASNPGAWQAMTETVGKLQLAPGEHFEVAVEVEIPAQARAGTADVYRVIERTAGEITGGLTIIVRAR